MRYSCLLFKAAIYILGVCIGGHAIADELPTEYSQTSTYEINYDDWNLILSSTVLDVGFSDRKPASRNAARNVTTRIKHGNTSKMAAEGSRVS